jgi:hypothetical protein
MEITVLFIQRIESYEGQNAPEAMVIADEWTMEDNPEWFEKEVEKILKENSDVAGHAIVTFDVDQDYIRKLCFTQPIKIEATIVNKEE